MADQPIITADKCFNAKRIIKSLNLYKECFDKFSEGFYFSIFLDNQLPIFIDTSVLLRYYEVSFAARKKLFDFIDRNKKRIVISSQVQYEFLKNREDVVQRFFEQVTKQIPKDFTTDILNKMDSFSNSNKEVLIDYPFIQEKLTTIKTELQDLLQKLNQAVKKNGDKPIDLIMKDDFLNLLSSCIFTDELLKEELSVIKKDFDGLSKDITPDKVKNLLNKQSNAFPGAGDIKEKPNDPYGDFIIFHEMMKYMELNKTDVMFLTFDNSKGDWMTKEKLPHFHYVTNMYANTKHIAYIVDAERTLEKVLDVNIESLVTQTNLTFKHSSLDISSLTYFIEASPLFSNRNKPPIDQSFIDELLRNGYYNIGVLEQDIMQGFDPMLHHEAMVSSNFNSIGVIRIATRLMKARRGESITASDGTNLKVIEDTALQEYAYNYGYWSRFN